ncbi:hypothetical protein AMS68_005150 [Peltaster fructicola]|uniref:MIT domain-containing protein n=1 Tax=Peltaster fructicola TaxID=286661 RepID=A0A6H0XY00_9PEZI|nr:hypothetical protein AMS68_005150 [Peltaster fructicola]
MSAKLHANTATVSPTAFTSNDMIATTTTNNSILSSRLPLQPQQKRQRYSSSRSNSISGSSVTTVQRAASRSSSRNGSSYPLRSQSPGETSLHALRLGGNGHARRRSIAVDPSDRSSSGNLESVNRWSQSTDSSLASSRKHHRASSGALLTSQSLSPAKRPQAPEQSPRIVAQSKQASQNIKPRQRPLSPVGTLERPWLAASRPSSRGNPPTTLPALQTDVLVARSERSDSNSTASTGVLANSAAVTPSTHSSYAPEYFTSTNASPRSVAKAARPQAVRTVTAPGMSLNYSRMPKAEDVKESAHYRRQSEHMGNMERDTRTSKQMEEKKTHAKPKDRAEREKKAMLSKALEKANTAVVLDNKQNFVGALDAYMDACTLLQQVMDRSVNAADRRKLDAIKVTYTTRIEELRILEEAKTTDEEEEAEKGLPERPLSDDSMLSRKDDAMSPIDGHLHEDAFIGTAVQTRLNDVPQLSYPTSHRDSFFSRTMADVEKASHVQNDDSQVLNSRSPEKQGRAHIVNQRISKLPAPEDTRYLPAPLGIKKSPSPTAPTFNWQHIDPSAEVFHTPEAATFPQEVHDTLGTISEGRSSRSSSVHSGSSQTGLRRKPIQGLDNTSNSELDAAFDAAVEAAYDEGLEPDFEAKPEVPVPSHARNVSEIKEIVPPSIDTFASATPFTTTNEDDEEERILDEFTQDYGHGFNFAFGTKSALPRQSDSSGYSRSTWQSSQASERMTAGTSLSTVAENDSAHRGLPMPNISPVMPVNLDTLPPSAPPPSTTLPAPPALPVLPPPNQLSGSTVRHRRLSGQHARELKIETSGEMQSRQRASTLHNHAQEISGTDEHDTDTHKEVMFGAALEASPSDAAHEHMLKSPPSLDMLSTFASSERMNMPHTPSETPRSDDTFGNMLQTRPTLMRKNPSSLSLRADLAPPSHTILLPSPGLHEMGDPTPLSATFTIAKLKGAQDPLTSQRVAFSSFASPMMNVGGHHLFDTSLTSGRLPTSPLGSPMELPVGLEPCPESFLMRPFWLMRCLASTITHSRGGYITTKLFIPREVWQTRGVKLRSVDDKVANCDLLTAALGQLSQVDTFDADAVMAELQRFEEVMERVQNALMKKLGGEVGVHGVTTMFRDAAPSTASSVVGSDKGSDTLSGTSKSHSSKGYLSSWRKLRSKSSGAPIGHSGAFQTGIRTGDRDLHAMSSVPMTSFVPVERRGQKRDLRNMSFDGPNKDYMGSLARLFQSVQVLDQIARQVEDPGLKHSSPTHVGLELSIRHAAEFFSFYICRFVLADLGVMLDKFIKRGTEWVMA